MKVEFRAEKSFFSSLHFALIGETGSRVGVFLFPFLLLSARPSESIFRAGYLSVMEDILLLLLPPPLLI